VFALSLIGLFCLVIYCILLLVYLLCFAWICCARLFGFVWFYLFASCWLLLVFSVSGDCFVVVSFVAVLCWGTLCLPFDCCCLVFMLVVGFDVLFWASCFGCLVIVLLYFLLFLCCFCRDCLLLCLCLIVG